MPQRKPFVGALVHRNNGTGCEAALITYVWPDDTVNLVAFSMHGDARPQMKLPHGDETGAWHWIEGEQP